jgi:basic membrane lipoprotein Med (substrate-binding protein (PBP1-ABC) superfamily)
MFYMRLKLNMKGKYPMIIMMAMLVLTMMITNTPVIAIDEVKTESPIAAKPIQATWTAALLVGGDETDLGFSYVAINAIMALNESADWDISISRQVAYPDQHNVASFYGDAGYDVVFCVGGQFIETTYFDVAWSYPNTLFVQIPGLNEYAPTPDNVVGLHPSFQADGHYLAGVLAGQMTETNGLGVVFGEWYEYLSMEFFAFKAGVESVNEHALVFCRVAGDWGDAALGKTITESLIETQNIDIVVQVADTTGRGVIAACVEADIAVIGTVADQNELAPNNTMTSIGMDTGLLMGIVGERVENGTAMSVLGGTSWKLPVGNYLYPYHSYDDKIPQSVKDSVDEAKAGIANGSITVPLIWDEEAGPPEDPYDPRPTITSPDDLTFVYGETDQSLSWTPTDINVTNTNFVIVVNGTEEATGTWISGTPITFNITSWEVGVYEVVITVNDGLGGSITDKVIVSVTESAVIPGYATGPLLIALLGTAAFLIKKRK